MHRDHGTEVKLTGRTRQAWRRGGGRWEVSPRWDGAGELARRLRTTPLIAQALHNRRFDDPESVRAFLDPKLTDLHPPELLAGMAPAAERLQRAVRDAEPVCLYGDYDVDGMTGVAILYRCLARFGADVRFYVPHRLEEGYGVNAAAVEKIAAEGAKLLVTVDCGISAVGPLARAGELGMDVIVTDHHTPGDDLPAAVAVVHPRLGGEYPNPDLCGAGVAFKLAWQLARAMVGSDRVDEPTREFLIEATSLAALGTIADVVPLVGENRALAVYGLKGLTATSHVGIQALIESAGLAGERLDAYHVGFRLAPRLNACGRMGHASLAVELLTRAEADRCREIAAYLETQNSQRQKVEREITAQAVEMVRGGKSPAPTDRAIVLASADWHGGVIGIVASRLVDRFARPAVLIAIDGDEAQGSGRSIAGFHMRDALAACAEHLTAFGGHAMAGGLRLPAGGVERFAAAFTAHAARQLSADDLLPTLRIDAEARLAELTAPVVEQLDRFAPFGPGNPRVVVAVRGARPLTPAQRLGRDGATLSLLLTDGTDRLRCVGFGMGELADRLVGVESLDVAGCPVLNRYRGRTTPELHLRDVRWD